MNKFLNFLLEVKVAPVPVLLNVSDLLLLLHLQNKALKFVLTTSIKSW